MLWAKAAGMCAHPDCRQRLVLAATAKDEAAKIGEVAHIVARRKDGPRGEFEIPPEVLHRYDNLVLLCANHHTMVDAQPETYPVDTLRMWKAEHEAWVAAVTANLGGAPWTAIVQEERPWIDLAEAKQALGAGNCLESVVELRNDPTLEGWEAAAARERSTITWALAHTPQERRRFAVFSLGRIPLAVQLGFALSDRVRAALFHFDRDRGSWSWAENAAAGGDLTGTVSDCDEGPRDEAAIRVSLSAEIRPETTIRCGIEIDIGTSEPSVRWLRTPAQLTALARIYAEALDSVRARECKRIHLYYAGPPAGAIVLGRGYNPRMNPELHVYEYRRGESPAYERALVLNQ
jgi:hypothetical protein